MNYYLVTRNHEYLVISEQERNEIMRVVNSDDMIFIKSADIALRGKEIQRIVRADELHKIVREQNPDMRNGWLHDGTPVVKVGGRWFLSGGSKNEEGFPEQEVDSHYYPEILTNTVIPQTLWAAIQNGKVPRLVLKDISSLGRIQTSPFAKELAAGMSMLGHKERTEIQEEVARELRKS